MIDDVPTTVFWNPSAGSAEQWAPIRARLEAMGNVEVRQSPDRDAAIEEVLAVANLCDGPRQLVVAAGGDGTVNTIVAGLMRCERRPTLGILPLGSGNDLARSLEIPLDPAKGLATLRTGVARPLDVMRVTSSDGSQCGANMLTGGNTGRFLERMTDELKRNWGPLCYLRGVVDLVPDLQAFRIVVTLDDGTTESFEALNVFVANGRTSGGGLAVSPHAELDDGLIDVVVVQDGAPLEIADLTAQYLVADYLEHDLVAFRRARHLEIASNPPLPLTLDGNSIGTTPLKVDVEHRALDVLAPA